MLILLLFSYYVFCIVVILKLINKKNVFDPFLYIYILFTFSISLTPINMLFNYDHYIKINSIYFLPFLVSIILMSTMCYIIFIEKITWKYVNFFTISKLGLSKKYNDITKNKTINIFFLLIFLNYLYSQLSLFFGQDISVKVASTVSSNGALSSMFINSFEILSIVFVINKYRGLPFYLFLLNILLGVMTGSKTYIFTGLFYVFLFYELNYHKIHINSKFIFYSLIISPILFVILTVSQVVRFARGIYEEATLYTSASFIIDNMELVHEKFSTILTSMLNRFDMTYISVFILENRDKVENLYSQFQLTFIGFIPRFLFPDKPDTGLSITFTPIWIGNYGSGNFGPTLIGSMFFGHPSMIVLSFLFIIIMYTVLLIMIKTIIFDNNSRLLGIITFIFISRDIIDSAWPFSLVITKIFAILLFVTIIIFILDFFVKLSSNKKKLYEDIKSEK
jgi:hypothetical protein